MTDTRALPLIAMHRQGAWPFLLAMAGWTIGFLAVLRLPGVEGGPLEALSQFQRAIAEWYGARATGPVYVAASCSGADQIALCLGVTLAYPVAWSRRLTGAFGGLVLILVLNTIRIGTLLTAAGTPELFTTLHLYVWPTVLTAGVAVYAVLWVRWSEGTRPSERMGLLRFGLIACVCLAIYAAAAPWTLTNPAILQAGGFTAQVVDLLLPASFGISASGNMLLTSKGAFLVTQECLMTPLLPLYVAAAVAWPRQTSRRLLALSLAVPLFFALGIVRLMIVALPTYLIDAPVVLVHGFFQLALGVMLVAIPTIQASTRSGARAIRPAVLAILVAVATATVAFSWWNGLLVLLARGVQPLVPHVLTVLRTEGDLQGALLILPVYQMALAAGLLFALEVRTPRRYAWAGVSLLISQLLLLVLVGEMQTHAGFHVHALALRAWAVGGAILAAVAWSRRGAAARSLAAETYPEFWSDVGTNFPSLTGAASTRLYRANEIRLLTEHLPRLSGSTLFKTDLWDEARNTQILLWAAEQGAHTFGIDLSPPTVRLARRAFGATPLGAAVADVRSVPFADASFDAIYSMGTIEHFPESQEAVTELARVLKPGGRLILGVPNLYDPFLRPLMVWTLQQFDAYHYGAERAFSRRGLHALLERAGLEVVGDSGVLFIPGWLRMLDLWCHARSSRLQAITALGVRLFERLDRRYPRLCRHGYLIASVGLKPSADPRR